jgi:hypothetical protein
MNHTVYRFPEQLRFKHLAKHELFMFTRCNGYPAEFQQGPFMKLSPRRYVAAKVRVVGLRIVPDIQACPVYQVESINAPVSDRVTDHLSS